MDAATLVSAVVHAGFLVVGAALVHIDIQQHRLPDRIVLPATAGLLALVAIHAAAARTGDGLVRAMLGGLVLGAFYLALRAASPHGMGGGDVKLAVLVGAFLAWRGWTALAVGGAAAFVLAAAWAIALLAVRRLEPDARIAFGPWMILGAWTGLLAV